MGRIRKDVEKYSDHFFTSCPVGLEELLEKEVKDLAPHQYQRQVGGVIFKSSAIVAFRHILSTRLSSRVYKKLFSFHATDPKDIYNKAVNIKWKSVIDTKQTFKIKTVFEKNLNDPLFKNSLYISQVLKDAIVDKFKRSALERPCVDKDSPHVSLLLRVSKEEENLYNCEIYLDLCGMPLSQRGYKKQTTLAPLKENLAAGLILSTQWEPFKHEFLDVMCGSGTLLVEALLIKGKIPPTFMKLKQRFEQDIFLHWSFEEHLFFQKDEELKSLFKKECELAYEQVLKGWERLERDPRPIRGYDLDDDVLGTCKKNLRKASLNRYVKLTQQDATKIRPPEHSVGIVICNPPYGERMGEIEQLGELYYQMGENFKQNYQGYKAYILTGNLELRKKIRLQTSKRMTFYNGPIECRLLEYDLY